MPSPAAAWPPPRDQLGPGPRLQTEWRRFDLLVQGGELATIIEFKYYLQRRTFGLQGEPLEFKGGPGPKNEGEFNACVHKLRTAVPEGVTDRRLILVYETQSNPASRNWIVDWVPTAGAIRKRDPELSVGRQVGH